MVSNRLGRFAVCLISLLDCRIHRCASQETGYACRTAGLFRRGSRADPGLGRAPKGKVIWYTSLAGSSYKELAQGFEKKYGVKVDVYRAAATIDGAHYRGS
jgi:hypothetical protein